jgi:hypothetical protein
MCLIWASSVSSSLYFVIFTERHGRVVNTPALYGVVPGSNLGNGYPDGFFLIFLILFRKIPL